jgi:hypothetical protein
VLAPPYAKGPLSKTKVGRALHEYNARTLEPIAKAIAPKEEVKPEKPKGPVGFDPSQSAVVKDAMKRR